MGRWRLAAGFTPWIRPPRTGRSPNGAQATARISSEGCLRTFGAPRHDTHSIPAPRHGANRLRTFGADDEALRFSRSRGIHPTEQIPWLRSGRDAHAPLHRTHAICHKPNGAEIGPHVVDLCSGHHHLVAPNGAAAISRGVYPVDQITPHRKKPQRGAGDGSAPGLVEKRAGRPRSPPSNPCHSP